MHSISDVRLGLRAAEEMMNKRVSMRFNTATRLQGFPILIMCSMYVWM